MSSSRLTHVILISGATVLSGIVNYLYNPLMLRYMDIEEFGNFASIISLTNLLGVLITGIGLFLTREYSKYANNLGYLRALTNSSSVILLIGGVILFLLYIFFVPIIRMYLHIDNTYSIVIAGLMLPIACIWTVHIALYKSLRKFHFFSVMQVMGPFLKLIIGITLVFAGMKLFGAIAGLILSWVITLIISYFYVRSIFIGINVSDNGDIIKNLFGEWRGVISFTVGSVLFTFLMNADILLVKNLYSPDIAGVYAGVAVLGKFLVFLLMSLETVYYGQIMEHTRVAVPRRLILEPLVLIGIVSLVSIVGTYWVGEYALTLMKSELSGQGGLLMLLVVYSGLLAHVSLVSKVLIGWGSRLVNPLLILGAGILLASVYLLPHESLTGFAMLLILPVAGIALTLSVVLGWGLLGRNRG